MERRDPPLSSFRPKPAVAQYIKTNKNDYVNQSLMAVCPLNELHVMKSSRLQYHIVQCKKSYKGTKVPCPYNHCEYFEPEDIVDHLAICESRAALEAHRYNSERNREKTKHSMAFDSPVLPGQRYTDEDWDEE